MTRTAVTLGATALWALGIAAPAAAQSARADIVNDKGAKIGTATLEQTPHGVLITVDVSQLPPGPHAFHIHEVGKCEPPFASAGGHYNPGAKKHGMKNEAGMHAGDFPNLDVPQSGATRVEVFTEEVTVGPGPTSVFDADGSAIVIHAGPDDYQTDPAGNAGARIACGVISKP